MGQRIADSDTAIALFAPIFAALEHEELQVAHLDGDLNLLKLDVTRGSQKAEVAVPLRTLIRDALVLEARAIVIAHNHPGGDPAPSRADRSVTRRLVEVARPLDIRLLDHLVFARGEWTSFRRMGLL